MVALRASFGAAALAALESDRFVLSLEEMAAPSETQWREIVKEVARLDIAILDALGQLEKHVGAEISD